MKRICLIILSIWAGIACTDPPIEYAEKTPPSRQLFEKLIDGQTTHERPEVGKILMSGSMCTATLVASDVAITAAHCVRYGTTYSAEQHGDLILETSAGEQRYPVVSYVSFGFEAGPDDIALLKLGQPVPPTVASPAALAPSAPTYGSQLTIYGYGCTERQFQSGSGNKRKFVFQQGNLSTNLCPGDSGGPVFSQISGAVTRINSAYRLDGIGSDVYGDVPANHGRLQATIADMTEGSTAPNGVPDSTYDPTIGVDEVCGYHYTVQQKWSCSGDGSKRFRCRKGHQPEFESCSDGCSGPHPSTGATCLVRSQTPRCGATYERYTDWTCTADAQHMLRCRQERLEIQPCRHNCNPGAIDENGCGP